VSQVSTAFHLAWKEGRRDRSPIIAYDGEQHPPYTFASSTALGCRLLHFWLAPNDSVYDALGSDYALMRLDRTIEIDRLARAAAHRQVSLPFWTPRRRTQATFIALQTCT